MDVQPRVPVRPRGEYDDDRRWVRIPSGTATAWVKLYVCLTLSGRLRKMTTTVARPTLACAEKRSRGRPTRSATIDPDALLRSARQVFARQGFEATSVREIARDAGVDPSLMAHHFGSKEALWTAVVEQIAHQAVPMIEATRKLRMLRVTARGRVERALVILVERVFEEPDIGLFFSTAATEKGERLDVLIERLVRPYHDVFAPLLAAGMDSGELAQNDPEVMYWMLINAVSRTVSYGHVLATFSSLPRRPRDFKRAVLEIARGMLGAGPNANRRYQQKSRM
ncbi:bacterial regulatory s, tetR family protein [Paraburkholderia xenovorans LB400]|nr:bacterial regulatory s, tetR family protein [Paraburkholderia xenovorans LB400]